MRTPFRHLLFAAAFIVSFPALCLAAGERVLEDFEWKDLKGESYRLADPAGSKLTVFAFSGIGCPLVNLYAPKLERIAQDYADDGVRFFWINSNSLDTADELVDEAAKFGITFPCVKDEANRIADILGAERTTEVFIIDNDRRIRYQGRIDSQYGYNYKRDDATENYLTDALTSVLSGQPVKVVQTESPGCIIGRTMMDVGDTSVTYTEHVSRILDRNCVTCHRDGEIAPFSLNDYNSAKRHAKMIQEVVNEKRMPPWLADDVHGTFMNKRAVSKTEMALLNKWIDNGAPEGDPAKLPPTPEFTVGWAIGEPDAIFEMPIECAIQAEGAMDYQYFGVKTDLDEDKWIKAIEVRPGNTAVVHHILVFIMYPKDRRKEQPNFKNGLDGYFASMVPGDSPSVYPVGMAKKLPKGASLIFQMHYTPVGTPQKDRSKIGVLFEDGPVEKLVHTKGISNEDIRIPPNDPAHVESADRTFKKDIYLLSLLPHMHVRGKAINYVATYPDGKTETLLNIPRWDFGWQNAYRFAEPKFIPKGTKIVVEAVYDNSTANPANPDPDRTVPFGEQTWDEMLIGYYDYYEADEDMTKLSKVGNDG